MPLFEYRCSECGEIHTEFRPIALRDRVSVCECGGWIVRQPTNAGLIGTTVARTYPT